MSLHPKLITVSILALSTITAFAAPTADMKVTGKIVTSSCTIDPSSTLDLDFSKIQPIYRDSYIFFTIPTDMTPTVKCLAPTSIKVRFTDNNSDSRPNHNIPFSGRTGGPLPVDVSPDNFYGLKDDNTGKSIGAFYIRYFPRVVSGLTSKSIYPFVSSDGNNWSNAPGYTANYMTSNSLPIITFSSIPGRPESIIPAEGTEFRFLMAVDATLLVDKLPVDANISANGSITMELSTL